MMDDGNSSARGFALGCLALALALVALLALAVAVMLPGPAHAEPGPVMVVVDLNAPAVETPAEFAAGSVAVFGCESKWDPTSLGSAGERGIPQIHPTHFPTMYRLGLSPESSTDLMRFAVRLWERSGWAPWSCQP